MDSNEIYFQVEDEKFTIDFKKVPLGSLFHMIMEMATEFPDACCNQIYNIPNMKKKDFCLFCNYLNKGVIPHYRDVIPLFPQFMIGEYHSYDLCQIYEREMRENMYNPGYADHPMCTDPYYRLVKYTKDITLDIPECIAEPNQKLFDKPMVFNYLPNISEKLKEWEFLSEIPGVFIAGGFIFAMLTGSPYNDIDLFIYGCTHDEAIEKVRLVYSKLEEYSMKIEKYVHISHPYKFCEVSRSRNAITFCPERRYCATGLKIPDIQIILRLYSGPSEILHGFDVDCCCTGYDGKDIWLTQRALFALRNGYNTVNFDVMSPSYCDRLLKYASRNMAIHIPHFSRENIRTELLERDIYPIRDMQHSLTNTNYCRLEEYTNLMQKQTGLSKLIIAEKCDVELDKSNYNEVLLETPGAISDYDINGRNLDKHDRKLRFVLHNRLMKLIKEGSLTLSQMKSSLWIYTNNISYLHICNEDMAIILKFMDETLKDNNLYPLIQTSLLLIKEGATEIRLFSTIISKILDSISIESDLTNLSGRTFREYLDMRTKTSDNKIIFIKLNVGIIVDLLSINESFYGAVQRFCGWDFPAKLQFKLTNPGEQMTNTFHPTVLVDRSEWYRSEYYDFK